MRRFSNLVTAVLVTAKNMGRLGFAAVLLVIGLELLAQSVCYAGGGPENVFLLVNSNSQDSLTVANHYIALRKIPPTNVLYLPLRGSKVDVPSSAFRSRILAPALAEIERRNLSGQIDYMIYSCDFPWRINFTRDFPEENFPLQLKPSASLTAATFFAKFVQEKRKEMIGLTTNLYFNEPVRRMTISRAFSSRYRWASGGMRARQGLSYMISAMLGVTEGRGNTVKEIVASLRRATAADATHPTGTVYFMKHQGLRSTPRHDQYDAAAAELQFQGINAKVLKGKFPDNKKNIIGLTCGTAFADVKTSGCSFLPGAFCDNLTSAGANFVIPKQMINNRTGKRRRFQVTVCDLIRHGATAACGTVIEPRNIPEKFPSPFVHAHYAHGCSLGEAFYQSVSGPYQQLLVGDPLCQPWADIPVVKVDGISVGKMLRGQVEMTPTVGEHKNPISEFELYVDGSRTHSCKLGGKLLLDTTTLQDGHHELRIVVRDDTPIETQGRLIAAVTVKNGRDAIGLTTRQKKISPGVKDVAIEVACTSQTLVELFCNSQKLGSLPSGTGSLKIATEKLGAGSVEVYAVSSGLRSKPLRLEIAL